MNIDDSEFNDLRTRHIFRIIDELERFQSPRHFDRFLIRDLTRRGWKPGYHLFWDPDTLELEVIKDNTTYERTLTIYADSVIRCFGNKIYVTQEELAEVGFYLDILDKKLR